MVTVFDWLSMAIFAALVVVFLQRSVGPRPDGDKVINYLPPAIGCALANYVGNNGYPLVSVILMMAVLVYMWQVIDPLNRKRKY